ncbi:MAG: DUF4340 domain-containing protein [Verrucomicrobiota bacterium]
MNSKQLLLLVLAAAVLGGGGLAVLRRRQADYNASSTLMGGRLLGEFDLNAVAGLRITQGSNSVHVAKAGDALVVRERGDYPANFGEFAELVRKVGDLKVAQPVKVGASRLPLLELTAESGTRVELLDKDGKAIQSLLLGKKHLKGEDSGGSPFGGGGFPDGRYVQVGSGVDRLALVADPLANANPKPEDWIDKAFVKVEQPVDILVKGLTASNSFHLTRTNEFADWVLADAAAGEQLDKNKLWAFGNLLSSASFNDVILKPEAAQLGLEQPATAAIRTAAGFLYTLRIGKPDGENYPVQVAVSATLRREREPAKDEKPEDKEKADKEFREKLARQEEKLKQEQALGKWTFTLSKWTLEALLKNRTELLADQKDAGKDDGKDDAPGDSPAEIKLPDSGAFPK